MSLKMYPVDICVPDNTRYVWVNERYFDGHTVLKADEQTKMILSKIDGATRLSDDMFQPSANGFGLYKSFLSAGTKTLLNIAQHPDVCFNLNECGSNALRLLFSTFHEGIVLWTFNILDIVREDISCDIEMEGQHFDSIQDLNSFCGNLDIWTCCLDVENRGYKHD